MIGTEDDMSDLLDLYGEKFMDALDKFYTDYELFKRNNASRTSTLSYNVYTGNPKNIFSHLLDVIYYAVLIYDNSLKSKPITPDDRAFMSAIKHVENTVKHTKNPPDIIDLISSTPQLSSTVLRVTRLPQLIMNANLISVWKDITFISVKPKWENQRENYNQHLRGHEVFETVKQLETIITANSKFV